MKTKIGKISVTWFFFLRPLTKNKELSTVCFAVSMKGKRIKHSTGITVPVSNWCKTTKRVKWGGDLVNAELDRIGRELDKKIREQVERLGDRASLGHIISAYNNSGDRMTLSAFLEIFLKQKSKGATPQTMRVINGKAKKIALFLSENNLQGTSLLGFGIPDLHRLGCWAKESRPASAFRIVMLVKEVFNHAILNGYLTHNHLSAYSLKCPRQKHPKYLTGAETVKLGSHPLNERLRKVADLFLFQCFTGLAYVDMARFDFETDLKKDAQGFEYIEKDRAKTCERSIIPLLPEAKAILERYDRKLPIISNEKYNAYLKEAAKEAGLANPGEVTSHIGRKTFAMSMLDLGYSVESVSRMLGHADTRMILSTYAKVSHNRIKKEFNDIHGDVTPATHPTQWTITKNAS